MSVNWDTNYLLFTKWLQTRNKVISYSFAKKNMNSFEIYGNRPVHKTARAK